MDVVDTCPSRANQTPPDGSLARTAVAVAPDKSRSWLRASIMTATGYPRALPPRRSPRARQHPIEFGQGENGSAGAGSATGLRLAARTRHLSPAPKVRFAMDSLLEGDGFELSVPGERAHGFLGCRGRLVYMTLTGGSRIRTCMGLFPVKWCFRFIASSLFGAGRAVLRPVACDQVRGARGRGQGTETLAQLGGLPPSGACVSQRLDA